MSPYEIAHLTVKVQNFFKSLKKKDSDKNMVFVLNGVSNTLVADVSKNVVFLYVKPNKSETQIYIGTVANKELKYEFCVIRAVDVICSKLKG